MIGCAKVKKSVDRIGKSFNAEDAEEAEFFGWIWEDDPFWIRNDSSRVAGSHPSKSAKGGAASHPILNQRFSVGLRSALRPAAGRRTAGGGCPYMDFLGGVGEVVVGVAVFVGEQDPEGVDAESGAERGMEEGEDAEDDGGDAGPGLALAQAESDADASRSEDQQGASSEIDEEREEAGGGLVALEDEVNAATEDQDEDGGNEEEASDDHPENGEDVEMAFEAGAGDVADEVADGTAALRAGLGVGMKFGSAASAEHGTLLNKDTQGKGGSSVNLGVQIATGAKALFSLAGLTRP